MYVYVRVNAIAHETVVYNICFIYINEKKIRIICFNRIFIKKIICADMVNWAALLKLRQYSCRCGYRDNCCGLYMSCRLHIRGGLHVGGRVHVRARLYEGCRLWDVYDVCRFDERPVLYFPVRLISEIGIILKFYIYIYID